MEWEMDIWKYYDVTHRRHLICNPTSAAKLDGVIELLSLERGARVVDVACGKGEMLVKLAERYGVSGVGVDISPFCIADCKRRLQERAPDAGVEFVEMNGADYRPASPGSFDLAVCMGASFVFGGHRRTLRALKEMTAPGGLVLVGEPFWVKAPEEEYLAAEEMARETFAGHPGNVEIGVEEGFVPLYAAASNLDEWDRYEALQWRAADEYASANPEDPDLPELLARVARGREIYLKWGRDTLGWALYLFRKPSDGQRRTPKGASAPRP